MTNNPMLKVVETEFNMWYNVLAEVVGTLFLLSKLYTAIIVVIASSVSDTIKSVHGLSNRTDGAIFFGPYTTENALIIGQQPYSAFTKGMVLK